MNYREFLQAKSQLGGEFGFVPKFMPKQAKDFQRHSIDWTCRKGRAATLADTGLGKTLMQLTVAQNVVEHTNKRVLIATPLAVGQQTIREAEKFGITAERSRDGSLPKSKIVVTNYEQLDKFNSSDFVGFVGDEASIMKNFDGKTKTIVTEFVRQLPYRFFYTATAAPNDYYELGTLSEALGELGYMDMMTRFFKEDKHQYQLGHGRTSKYRLRGHAEQGFWKWVCSWARAFRKPSDLGDFSDADYNLPELIQREHEVKANRPAAGRLFDVPAQTLEEQREEQRRTIPERCAKVTEIVASIKTSVMWCYLNDEADTLERMVEGSKQVSGSDSDEEKEEKLIAFATGQLTKLIIKPKIGAFGLNWQHCNHTTFFPSHSFEQIYQGIRRFWRFGQLHPVTVDMITTEGGSRVLENYKAKATAASVMFTELVRHMNEANRIQSTPYGSTKERIPSWLSSNKS